MFQITDTPIDTEAIRKHTLDPKAGGFVSFEGWVRNHHEGKQVESLEYSAYVTLAEKEGSKIIQEALDKFSIIAAQCSHRVGHLAIGDMAVYVAVASAHRKEAFEACRYIIDETKSRVPIWKKEHYLDGSADWPYCEQCAKGIEHEH